MSRALRLAGGWAGVLGPVVYVTTWAVLGATRAGYDPTAQAISELGEVGAATAPAMSAGFALFGLAAVPFAAALRRVLPGDGRWASASAALCGVATVGAAAFPCTPGCPGPAASGTDSGHAIAAVAGYLALTGTPLLAWTATRRREGWQGFARWSLAAGCVSVVLMLAWALGWFGDAGGAAQRTFNTLADMWWITAGVVVLRGRPRAVEAPPERI